MTFRDFQHSRPTTVDEVLAALDAGGWPYAGGTELIAAMRIGLIEPEHLVDLKRVDELAGIRSDGDVISIGATTRHAEVAGHDHIRTALPVVSRVAETVGNPRVRWQGTVAGNVCFAEPRSDLVPVLMALGATAEMVSSGGARSALVEDLIDGPFSFDKEPEELVTGFNVPTGDIIFQHYEQVRLAERPTAGLALVGRSDGWCLVVAAATYAPMVVHLEAPEQIDPDQIAEQADVVADGEGSEDYKKHLIGVLARRMRSAAMSGRKERA